MTPCTAGRRRGGLRFGLVLAGLAATSAATLGHEPPPPSPAKPASNRSGGPNDPVSLMEGSGSDWSVVDGGKGCFLLSAYRKGSSRLAIGQHPAFGRGLFLVNLGLSTPDLALPERLSVGLGEGELAVQGRVVANMLVFAALDPAAEEAILGELAEAGTLWITVRNATVAHGGGQVGAAVARFRATCGASH